MRENKVLQAGSARIEPELLSAATEVLEGVTAKDGVVVLVFQAEEGGVSTHLLQQGVAHEARLERYLPLIFRRMMEQREAFSRKIRMADAAKSVKSETEGAEV